MFSFLFFQSRPSTGHCLSDPGLLAVCWSSHHSGWHLDTRPDTSLTTAHLQTVDQHENAAFTAEHRCATFDIVLHRGLAFGGWPFLLLDLLAVRAVSGAHTDCIGGLLRHL